MTVRTYAQKMSNAKVMLDGLQSNLEQLKKRGIDQEFLTRFKAHLEKTIHLNSEQEKLKADLKLKTAALTLELKELTALYNEAKKMVKVQLSQEQWKEFGIEDKR